MKLRALNGEDGQNVAGNPTLRALAMNAMIGAAPLIDYMEFYSMQGAADKLPKAADAVGGSARAINSDYTGVETAPLETDSIGLKILGDKIKTDHAYERRGQSIGSERARQLTSFCEGFGRHYVDQFFNGDNTGTNLNGVKALVDSTMLKTFDTENGGEVPLGNSTTNKTQQQKFLEALDELCGLLDSEPSCLAMNRKAIARLRTIGREYITTTSIQSILGNKMELISYNGVPIVPIGYKKAASSGLVLPNTETCGTSTSACTSIYALKFGEATDITIETNVGLIVKDLGLIPPHYVTEIEIDSNIILQNVKALARLQGLKFV